MLSQNNVKDLNVLLGSKLAGEPSTSKRSGKWECVLFEQFIGEYLIVPLTTAKMLKSEGYVMNNCCRDYRHLCEQHRYAIFSLRSRSGERLATLGLVNEDGCWVMDQCFGPSNSEVLEEVLNYLDEEETLQTEYFPAEIYYIAHEVVRLMNSMRNTH